MEIDEKKNSQFDNSEENLKFKATNLRSLLLKLSNSFYKFKNNE